MLIQLIFYIQTNIVVERIGEDEQTMIKGSIK